MGRVRLVTLFSHKKHISKSSKWVRCLDIIIMFIVLLKRVFLFHLKENTSNAAKTVEFLIVFPLLLPRVNTHTHT